MNRLRYSSVAPLSGHAWNYFSNSYRSASIVAMSKKTGSNRQKVKEKQHYQASYFVLKIVGSGAQGAPKSVFLESDQINYAFNAGEGLQRLANEYKCRLPKLKNVFITAPNWKNLGGLPGLFLTMQAFGVNGVSIHGPTGTNDILNGVRQFVCLDKIYVHPVNDETQMHYEDSVMTVSYVRITGKDYEKEKRTCKPFSAGNSNVISFKRAASKPQASPPRKVQRTSTGEAVPSNIERITDVYCYICKLRDRPGTLNLELCLEKGLTPGPILRLLKEGKDVTLEDGTVVRSTDVCSPTRRGAHFAVVDCPSEEYLDNLLGNERFKLYQGERSEENPGLSCIVHFAESSIVESRKYKEWMKEFGPDTYHLLVNEKNTCLGSESIYRHQYRLHSLEPNIFPLLPDVEPEPESWGNRIVRARTMSKLSLKPNIKLEMNDSPILGSHVYKAEEEELKEIADKVEAARADLAELTKSLPVGPLYPRVLVLGTGSSMPSKTRNVSGILVHLNEQNSMLLECGEGTYGQLCRYYGRDKVRDILASIKVVYASHLHADHHIGLMRLLLARREVVADPVVLLLPEGAPKWLKYYSQRFEDIEGCYTWYLNHVFIRGSQGAMSRSEMKEVFSGFNIRSIETAYVDHCINAYGVSITLLDGTQICYSGDTRPCDAMVELGKNCDLLIHEATVEDGMEKEADMKMHSTITQAVNIGLKMKAKNILLTHFSQRYSKLPFLPTTSSDWNNVAVAYDFMVFSLWQFKILCKLSPVFEVIYSDFKEQLEDKAVKRRARLQDEA